MSGFTGLALTCARGDRMVFADLDFSLAPGEALVLTGANGSGKSSLLRLMAGLARPEAGRIAWDGADIADDPAAHAARLHYVGHLDAVKPALTVAENLRFWAALRGGGDGAKGVEAALAGFGIDHLAGISARFLSAGQRRRLALARTLAAPSALWLLDEPTVALDADGVAAVHVAIEAHRAAGGCCVVSTNVSLTIGAPRRLDLGEFAP